MPALDPLIACTGPWTGTNLLQVNPAEPGEHSNSTLALTPILSQRFVRIDYTWSYRSKPQEGSLLLGFDDASQSATAIWIDTWHMGKSIMTLRGEIDDKGALNVRGSYPAPPGPDWGWRIQLTPTTDLLTLTMYNIDPTGDEALAVRAEYKRP